MINPNTPIEKHTIKGKTFEVKREDLYSSSPGPSLAKLRGIKKLLDRLYIEGYKTIGVMDTRISKAGWGLAYLVKLYYPSLKVVCFYPRLKSDTKLSYIQFKEASLNAEVIPLKAGRTNVLYYQSKKILATNENYPKSYMMPMGLVLPETLEEVSKIIIKDKEIYKNYKTIVVSLGTGTICAGLIKGFEKIKANPKIYGVSCGMSLIKIKKRIKSLLLKDSLPKNIKLINLGYDYYDEELLESPFPSSPYYDKKALKFLLKNYKKLPKPILFWNIGV